MKHLICIVLSALAVPAVADPPEIKFVRAGQGPNGWRFDVTLEHSDTGWDHYADGWRLLDMEGNQIGMRLLAHPHVNEQPFTRSLGGVQIAEGTTEVQIEARCIVDGWTGTPVTITLR